MSNFIIEQLEAEEDEDEDDGEGEGEGDLDEENSFDLIRREMPGSFVASRTSKMQKHDSSSVRTSLFKSFIIG